jgi:hypothetical protein
MAHPEFILFWMSHGYQVIDLVAPTLPSPARHSNWSIQVPLAGEVC